MTTALLFVPVTVPIVVLKNPGGESCRNEDARFLVVPPHWKCERDPWGYSTANASSLIERATASNAHRSEFLLDESGRGKLPPVLLGFLIGPRPHDTEGRQRRRRTRVFADGGES